MIYRDVSTARNGRDVQDDCRLFSPFRFCLSRDYLLCSPWMAKSKPVGNEKWRFAGRKRSSPLDFIRRTAEFDKPAGANE